MHTLKSMLVGTARATPSRWSARVIWLSVRLMAGGVVRRLVSRLLDKLVVAGLAAVLFLPLSAPVLAGPGAHGPNGEHLDAPPAKAGGAATQLPVFEAASELFEVVGSLSAGELSLLIDRFDTNQPVLKAQVEVESGGVKAPATFHADLGDYAVDDPALLRVLTKPGEHALVLTIVAAQDSDLLDAVLKVAAPAAPAAHGHGPGLHAEDWALVLLGLVAVGVGFALWRRRVQRERGQQTPRTMAGGRT